MLLARAADRIGGILAIAVSARYLTPTDFGMFQMALSIVMLVELISMFGFEWALMRHPAPEREHYDTAFTLQIIVSLCAFLLVLALAHPFAAYYRTPDLVVPAMTLAVVPLIFGVNNLAVAHLRRELRFETDFWRMCIPRIVSLVAAIALAVSLQSYWALIFGVLVAKVSSTLMGYVLHPYRPRLSLSRWRELLGFSVWMQLSNIIDGMRLRVADLVIGRMLGSHPLAIYNMSNELAALPQSEFVGALNSAVFPKYSRMQGDVTKLKAAYLDILGLTLLVGLPVACGLAFVAPAAVRVLLGPAWMDAADIIRIVAFGALANAIASNSSFVLMSAGRPNLNTVLSGLTLAFLVVLLVALTHVHGLTGAAIGFTSAAVCALPVHLVVLHRVIGIRLRDVVPRAWRSLAAVTAMSAVMALIVPEAVPQSFAHALLLLLGGMAIGGTTYCAGVVGLWLASGRPESIERMLFDTARDIGGRVGERLLGTSPLRRS